MSTAEPQPSGGRNLQNVHKISQPKITPTLEQPVAAMIKAKKKESIDQQEMQRISKLPLQTSYRLQKSEQEQFNEIHSQRQPAGSGLAKDQIITNGQLSNRETNSIYLQEYWKTKREMRKRSSRVSNVSDNHSIQEVSRRRSSMKDSVIIKQKVSPKSVSPGTHPQPTPTSSQGGPMNIVIPMDGSSAKEPKELTPVRIRSKAEKVGGKSLTSSKQQEVLRSKGTWKKPKVPREEEEPQPAFVDKTEDTPINDTNTTNKNVVLLNESTDGYHSYQPIEAQPMTGQQVSYQPSTAGKHSHSTSRPQAPASPNSVVKFKSREVSRRNDNRQLSQPSQPSQPSQRTTGKSPNSLPPKKFKPRKSNLPTTTNHKRFQNQRAVQFLKKHGPAKTVRAKPKQEQQSIAPPKKLKHKPRDRQDDELPSKPTFLNEKSCPSMAVEVKDNSQTRFEGLHLNEDSILASQRNNETALLHGSQNDSIHSKGGRSFRERIPRAVPSNQILKTGVSSPFASNRVHSRSPRLSQRDKVLEKHQAYLDESQLKEFKLGMSEIKAKIHAAKLHKQMAATATAGFQQALEAQDELISSEELALDQFGGQALNEEDLIQRIQIQNQLMNNLVTASTHGPESTLDINNSSIIQFQANALQEPPKFSPRTTVRSGISSNVPGGQVKFGEYLQAIGKKNPKTFGIWNFKHQMKLMRTAKQSDASQDKPGRRKVRGGRSALTKVKPPQGIYRPNIDLNSSHYQDRFQDEDQVLIEQQYEQPVNPFRTKKEKSKSPSNKSNSSSIEFNHASPGMTLKQQKKSYVAEFMEKAGSRPNKWRRNDYSLGARGPIKDKMQMTSISWNRHKRGRHTNNQSMLTGGNISFVQTGQNYSSNEELPTSRSRFDTTSNFPPHQAQPMQKKPNQFAAVPQKSYKQSSNSFYGSMKAGSMAPAAHGTIDDPSVQILPQLCPPGGSSNQAVKVSDLTNYQKHNIILTSYINRKKKELHELPRAAEVEGQQPWEVESKRFTSPPVFSGPAFSGSFVATAKIPQLPGIIQEKPPSSRPSQPPVRSREQKFKTINHDLSSLNQSSLLKRKGREQTLQSKLTTSAAYPRQGKSPLNYESRNVEDARSIKQRSKTRGSYLSRISPQKIELFRHDGKIIDRFGNTVHGAPFLQEDVSTFIQKYALSQLRTTTSNISRGSKGTREAAALQGSQRSQTNESFVPDDVLNRSIEHSSLGPGRHPTDESHWEPQATGRRAPKATKAKIMKQVDLTSIHIDPVEFINQNTRRLGKTAIKKK